MTRHHKDQSHMPGVSIRDIAECFLIVLFCAVAVWCILWSFFIVSNVFASVGIDDPAGESANRIAELEASEAGEVNQCR